MGFVERENEILKTIKSMAEARLDFIVVGGYAVSALARHRFSVDCDIVTPKEEHQISKKFYTRLSVKTGMSMIHFH